MLTSHSFSILFSKSKISVNHNIYSVQTFPSQWRVKARLQVSKEHRGPCSSRPWFWGVWNSKVLYRVGWAHLSWRCLLRARVVTGCARSFLSHQPFRDVKPSHRRRQICANIELSWPAAWSYFCGCNGQIFRHFILFTLPGQLHGRWSPTKKKKTVGKDSVKSELSGEFRVIRKDKQIY